MDHTNTQIFLPSLAEGWLESVLTEYGNLQFDAKALKPFCASLVLLLAVLYACTNPVKAHTINK